MQYLFLFVCILISNVSYATDVIKKTPVLHRVFEENIDNLYDESPQEIARIEKGINHQIQYMIDNYTVYEMAQYAIEYNKAQIAAAKDRGTTPPQRLTKEILQDKEKIAEYLRSQFQIRD